MEWLNYHHLFYFWTVAKAGSIAAATKKLRLSQPTISGQIRKLEKNLGEKLFLKMGRGLRLTDVGQTVFRYADEIFSVGKELQETLRGIPSSRPLRFSVGIADVVPKWLAYRLLEPILKLPESIYVDCHEGKANFLLSSLASHNLDLVISDQPADPSLQIRVHNHKLGQSKVGIFSSKAHVHLRRNFPKSLNGAPFLLPNQGTVLRQLLDEWFQKHSIYPKAIGEFEDSALLKMFARRGAGLFAGALSVKAEMMETYDVSFLGKLEGVSEIFYAISPERKIRHPATLALFGTARRDLF